MSPILRSALGAFVPIVPFDGVEDVADVEDAADEEPAFATADVLVAAPNSRMAQMFLSEAGFFPVKFSEPVAKPSTDAHIFSKSLDSLVGSWDDDMYFW